MAFAGGFADKIGNEYETWWTLRRLTQLLRGDIDSLAVEPIGADGAELWIEVGGMRTFDQVKFRSSGQWTPARLRTDGVLARLAPHYATGHRVCLVLSQPSEEFERLIALAAATSTGADLRAMVSDPTSFDLLQDAWSTGADQTRHFLLQTTVRHDGLPHLKEYVELALESLLTGNVMTAVAVLRRLLDENLTKVLTSSTVWSALRTEGLLPRPRVDSGPTISMLRDGLSRHVKAIRRTAPNGLVTRRNEVDEIVTAITDSSESVVVVVGKAGAGKSFVVADAAEQLAHMGHHVAALRLDRVEPDTSTAAQLGASLGFERSLVVSLSEVSPEGFAGVLVIDQLDAVSAYSGRMPDVFEAVDDALSEAHLLGNVKVVLAVRSIDLKEDPRLRKLVGTGVPVVEVGMLDVADIKAHLSRLEVDITSLDNTTIELLRLPIHLFVFSELPPELRAASYGTLSSLYSAYTQAFRIRMERDGLHDEWPLVSRLLVDRMNEDEALTVPAALLRDVRPLTVKALVSAGVLTEDRGRLALFHETYFDYLFASSFSPRGQNLVEWFMKSGQGLFRRSQLRQLLTYIAAEERSTFISQILEIAKSELRPHLIAIAYSVLAAVPPTTAEWVAVKPLLAQHNPFAMRLLSLIGEAEWFTVVDSAGDIDSLLDDPAWNEILASKTANLAADFPERTLELLAPRLTHGEIWVRALRRAIEASASPVLSRYAVDQIGTGSLDLPDDPFDPFASYLLHRLVDEHPLDALNLLVATIVRDLQRAIDAQAPTLKGVLTHRTRRSAAEGVIEKLSATLQQNFVNALLPVIEMAACYKPSEGRGLWRNRGLSSHYDFEDSLYFSFDAALTELARNNPELAIPLLDRLSSRGVNALDFLVCRAMHAATSDQAADWLLASETHLDVGWVTEFRWESRRLVEYAGLTCSTDRFTELERILLYWTPEGERRATDLKYRGSAELELLSSLPKARISRRGARRLEELRRKFPIWEPRPPESVSGGSLRSPIARQNALMMSDAHWIRAADKYGHRGRFTYRGSNAFGGATELADLMGDLAKENPSEFIDRSLRFPSSMPPAYIERVIRNVTGQTSQLEIRPLLTKFRSDYPTDSGRTVIAAIREYAGTLTDELFTDLLALADDEDPVSERAREATNGGYAFGGDFVTAGINSTRGLVASTLARVVFTDPSRLGPSLDTIRRLASDPIVAVRSLAAEAALAYAAIEREGGLELIAELLEDNLVLTSSSALRALRWAMLWDADRFAPYLTRALNADDAHDAGAVWANCTVNDALGSTTADVTSLSDRARLGAAEALFSHPGIAPELIAVLYDDPSADVRRQAASSLQFLRDVDAETVDHLVSSFVQSTGFDESVTELLRHLEDLPGQLPALTWDICHRVIESLKLNLDGQTDLASSDLIAVIVRLYRSSDEQAREASLDLIDETVHLQIWRADELLDQAR